MNLSTHFTLAELTRSQTAARLGIDMTPSADVIANLSRLCLTVLEPIRAKAMRPIVVTSGYRPPELNAYIGGSRRSDHVTGRAADIHAIGLSLEDLARVVRSMPELPLRQCIEEYRQWLHVSIPAADEPPMREFLLARYEDGTTRYTEWV